MIKSFGFILGVCVGGVVTKLALDSRYERIIQEEVDKVKEYYKNLNAQNEKPEIEEKDKTKPPDEEADKQEPKENMSEYKEKAGLYKLADRDRPIAGVDYSQYSETAAQNEHPRESDEYRAPYVISEEEYMTEESEFNDLTEEYEILPFDKVTLTYYEDDDTLIDDAAGPYGTRMDIEETIGRESLNRFGEYGKDVVYVRNEKFGTDYEVICEHMGYERDVLGMVDDGR